MNEPFPIIDTSDWSPTSDEMMGTKPKCWLRSPPGNGVAYTLEEMKRPTWLFKWKSRQNSDDDWSEKVASELAARLGIPHAEVELANRKGDRGVMSRNLLAEYRFEELIPGNRLLVEADTEYPIENFYHVAQHTLKRVFGILGERRVGLPPGWAANPAIVGATDLFTGYLLLDAWIGNTDRHHENWAVLKLSDGQFALSPSYDHAASLGHNVTDAKREEKLNRTNGAGVEEFVASPKVRSAFFRNETDPKPVSPLDAFRIASAMYPAAAKYWLEQLRRIEAGIATDILNRVPDTIISKTARRFSSELLRINHERLLKLTV